MCEGKDQSCYNECFVTKATMSFGWKTCAEEELSSGCEGCLHRLAFFAEYNAAQAGYIQAKRIELENTKKPRSFIGSALCLGLGFAVLLCSVLMLYMAFSALALLSAPYVLIIVFLMSFLVAMAIIMIHSGFAKLTGGYEGFI